MRLGGRWQLPSIKYQVTDLLQAQPSSQNPKRSEPSSIAGMLSLVVIEEVAHATDYDETLLPIAIGVALIGLGYAAVATWIVTPKGEH